MALSAAMGIIGILPLAPAALSGPHIALPFQEEGALDGARYKIQVPGNWNGTLLVWAHGYVDKADHPGEVDFWATFTVLRGSTSLEELLLSNGYALAGSAYKENGWAVKEGIQNTLALTNYFRGRVGKPLRTIIWGNSLGSIVALASMEKYPATYDGAIPVCTIGTGTPKFMDYILAISLAYDVAFGWQSSWGEVGNVRDDLDFQTEVFQILISQVQNPANFGRFEFIRLVNDLPAVGGGSTWILQRMFSNTEARAELERRSLGPGTQNVEHIYSLTSDEITYLNSLGVDAEAMLAEMNARTDIQSESQSRLYLKRYYEFAGDFRGPIISLHTWIDPNVPAFYETALNETVQHAGKGDLLVQAFTDSSGHCNFSDVQMLTAVQVMEEWIENGERPGSDAFPVSLGFIPGYLPPPFPHGYP